MARKIRDALASKLYRMFQGRNPVKLVMALFYVPRKLVFLGRAVSIVYEIDKKNGGGDGTVATYEHTFETPVGLYMDERAGKQLYLIGQRLTVTKAGIEN